MQGQPQGDLRALKALVGILGVLIVLGTALVVGTVIHRLYANHAPPSIQATPLAGGPVAAQLLPGEKIQGIAGAGGEFALWVNGPQGGRVLLLNPANGQISVALQTLR